VSGPPAAHVRQDSARHVQEAEDVCCEHTFNLDGARFLDSPEQTVARVVHENVNASELFDSSCSGVARLRLVCDIQRQLEQPGMVGNGRGIARGRDDRIGRESCFHDEGAEPARRAGDEPCLHGNYSFGIEGGWFRGAPQPAR
jgi:hypothetical protein